MAQMLPRTVASFYGSAVPRPYVMHDREGEVLQDRVDKPRVNGALVGARALAPCFACACWPDSPLRRLGARPVLVSRRPSGGRRAAPRGPHGRRRRPPQAACGGRRRRGGRPGACARAPASPPFPRARNADARAARRMTPSPAVPRAAAPSRAVRAPSGLWPVLPPFPLTVTVARWQRGSPLQSASSAARAARPRASGRARRLRMRRRRRTGTSQSRRRRPLLATPPTTTTATTMAETRATCRRLRLPPPPPRAWLRCGRARALWCARRPRHSSACAALLPPVPRPFLSHTRRRRWPRRRRRRRRPRRRAGGTRAERASACQARCALLSPLHARTAADSSWPLLLHQPSPRVRPEATPHRAASQSGWSSGAAACTPTPAAKRAQTPSTSVKKHKAEKRRRRL